MQGTPNLFGDLGYHEDLLKPGQANKLKQLLTQVSGEVSGVDRVMFGTDWLMLERVADWQSYADRLHNNLGPMGAGLTEAQLHAVFYQNAARFFSLSSRATR